MDKMGGHVLILDETYGQIGVGVGQASVEETRLRGWIYLLLRGGVYERDCKRELRGYAAK
jgi:hypothetical protein